LVEIAASRFALLAMTKAVHSAQFTVHSFGRGIFARAFLWLVAIAASRFALLAMTCGAFALLVMTGGAFALL
jgi:hypothetical protein